MERYTNYRHIETIWTDRIPSEWGYSKAKRFFSITLGKMLQPNQESANDELLDYLCSINLSWDGLNLSEVRQMWFSPQEKGKYRLQKGDLLVTEGGDVAVSSFWNNELNECYIQNAIHLVRSKFNDNLKFLFYWLQFLKSSGYIDIICNKATITHFTKDKFGSIPLFCPSVIEQTAIITYLDRSTAKIDNLLSDLQSQATMLDRYKQELIANTITHGLDKSVPMKDSGVDWIGKIPQAWSINKIRFLGTLKNGISKGGDSFGAGFPFVNYGDVYNNPTLPTEVSGLVESSAIERNLYSVKSGDVFFTRTSETVEEIGIASTCVSSIPDATFAGFLIRFRPTSKLLTKDFAKYYFRSDILRKHFVKEMMIVTRASLGQNLLKNTPVPLPPVHEQEEIAAFLDKKTAQIDGLIADIKTQIDKLKQYRQIVIHDAVTGKIKVSEG